MSEMSFSDFDFEDARLNQLASQQVNSLDNQLYVQFYRHAELDSFRTREEGRKIFNEYIYTRILIPANRLNIIERRTTDEDKLRFARQYTQFLDKGEQLQVGTPLDQLQNLSAAQVLELRHLKVETVEQLAGLPDTTAQMLGTGGQELKQRAIRFLDRTGNAEVLSDKVRSLTAQLEILMAERAQATAKAAPDVIVKPTVAMAAPALAKA